MRVAATEIFFHCTFTETFTEKNEVDRKKWDLRVERVKIRVLHASNLVFDFKFGFSGPKYLLDPIKMKKIRFSRKMKFLGLKGGNKGATPL